MRFSKSNFLKAAFMLALILGGCSANEQNENKLEEPDKETVKKTSYEFIKAVPHQIDHIQGMGYPGNDTGLYIGTDEGIKTYIDGEWLEATSQNHNYMGFQTLESGFITSGNLEDGSELKKPLGIVKSTDKGATLEKLAFYGDNFFQFLSAGYGIKMIYIINQNSDSALEPGVYRTENEGKSWEPVSLNGLESNTLGMIAAHPFKTNIMAMSTRSGLFLSEDKGENMKRISDEVMTTALTFSENSLYFSSVEKEKVMLSKIELDTSEISQIEIPYLNYDNPITYLSTNYQNEQIISFATYLKDIYQSKDGGKTWERILKNGRFE